MIQHHPVFDSVRCGGWCSDWMGEFEEKDKKMKVFTALFNAIFDMVILSFKKVRDLRRNDTPTQEFILWLAFVVVVVLLISYGVGIWGP